MMAAEISWLDLVRPGHSGRDQAQSRRRRHGTAFSAKAEQAPIPTTEHWEFDS
jgi:hypothetical protein